jgi:hypothetical protein
MIVLRSCATSLYQGVERVHEMEKQGQLASVTRIRVATLENRVASVQS